MSHKIIRVVETITYEYTPYEESQPGRLQEWYQEKGCTTLAEAMEVDRAQAEATDSDEWVGPEEYATEVGKRSYQFNIVTVPDNYDHTDPQTEPEWDEQEVQVAE